MPSEGDAVLLNQGTDGVIDLEPVYYGGECMGPHFQVLDPDNNVVSRFRLKLKRDGRLELKKGDS